MKRLIPVICASAAIMVAPLGVVDAADAHSAALTAKSASAIATLALKAAHAKGTCLNVAAGAAVGYHFGASTESGSTSAQETVTYNAYSGHVRLVKGIAYLRDDAAVMQLQFGKTDSRYVNKWIAIPRTSSFYENAVTGLLFSSMITEVRPAGALTKTKVTTLHGTKVIGLEGVANHEMGLTKGVETLFVSLRAPYLPVELKASGRTQGVATTLTVTFSKWGTKFHVVAPHPSVLLSKTTL